MTFLGQSPFVTNDTFIAPTASVIGEVTNWDQSSVWYGAVVRADSSHPITIGFTSSVGEGSVVVLGKGGREEVHLRHVEGRECDTWREEVHLRHVEVRECDTWREEVHP